MPRTPTDPAAEVVVVGAGPAGMAAAAQAAASGCAVTVIDTYPAPGGQYHRTAAPGLDRRARDPLGQAPPPPGPVAAFSDLVATGRITFRSATTIWTASMGQGPAPFRLHLTGVGQPLAGTATVRTRSIVLATGASDRVLPFPGWDLPGVVTAGGAQALLKGQGIRVGEQVVVGGSGPFLFPVAAALAAAGCDVREVVEAQGTRIMSRHLPVSWTQRAKLVEAVRFAWTLTRHRVPFRSRSAVTAAAGDGRLEQVTISRLGPDWAPIVGKDRTVAVDTACISFGFVPQVGLAALLGCAVETEPLWGDPAVTVDDRQATTTPDVFAAGEITGVTGSDGAAAEGAIAGLAVAVALGRIDEATFASRARALHRVRARHRRFAAALAAMYQRPAGWLDWLSDDTIVCRCEEVPHSTIRTAIAELGASDLRSVKLTTRCGMGYCQGRMCGDTVAAIVTRASGGPPADTGALSVTPVLTPVPLSRFAELIEDDQP
jgi:D-hydroxyproline dehydrogenase subunit alpha